MDWENPVGATASVSFIGAFRFLGQDEFLSPRPQTPPQQFLARRYNKILSLGL